MLEERKTIKELLEIHGDELKEYLLGLPMTERRSVCKELLKVMAEMEEKNKAEQSQRGRSEDAKRKAE